MNYFTYLRNYWEWRRFNSLSYAQSTLYLAILHCANSCRKWENFAVPARNLMNLCNMPKATFYRTRNELIDSGLILCSNTGSVTHAFYTVLPLIPTPCQSTDEGDTAGDNHKISPPCPTQTAPTAQNTYSHYTTPPDTPAESHHGTDCKTDYKTHSGTHYINNNINNNINNLSKEAVRDNVFLTKDQLSSLKEKYGEEEARQILDYLSWYKKAKGVIYACDFDAIERWVAGKILRDRSASGVNNSFSVYSEDYDHEALEKLTLKRISEGN